MLRQLTRRATRKFFALAVAGAVFGGVATGRTAAQSPTPQEQQTLQALQALQQRLDQLEKQNRELQETVRNLQVAPPTLSFQGTSQTTPQGTPQDVRAVVTDVLKEQAKSKADSEVAAKKKAEDEGTVVGSNLNFAGRWKNGELWFETPAKDFAFHLGGRVQYDIAFVQAPDNVQFGNGGFGVFDDATNFRRARITAQGTFWETFNYIAEFDFVNSTQAIGSVTTKTEKNAAGDVTNVTTTTTNNTYNTPVPTDLWLEATQLPIFGNFRVGNLKAPIGFEHYTSSRFLNFMERSNMFDSYLENGNNGFETGMMLYNYTENQRATAAVSYTKTTRNIFGTNVGDGEWGGTARLTCLPVWEDDGRCFVHLGVGTQYRGADDQQFRLRSRTEIRNGSASTHTIAAIAQLQTTEGQFLVQPEFVAQMGPWLLQSEFAWTDIEGVNKIIRTPTQTNVTIPSRNYTSKGAYIEVLYFLTGENRVYNKKLPALGRVVPFRNAYFVPGENGGYIFSQGAWQVGARYSYLNQNDNGILGGEINSLTLGLNWFLNPNAKIQWNYEIARRNVGTDATNGNPNGNGTGDYQGVGVRFAFDF